MKASRLIGFGVFVAAGVVLFTVALFMIGDRRMLFQDSFQVYTEFSHLSGLQNGAPVRVAGKDAGEVTEIEVPPGPSAKFRIQIRIAEELHPLVRMDSVATILTDGLVGNKYLLISTGTEQAVEAPDGSTIPSREAFDFADLIQQASSTVDILNETIVQLRGDLEETLGSTKKTIDNTNDIITSAGKDIKQIAKSGNRMADDMSRIVAGARAGEGTLGKLIRDEELYDTMRTIAKDASLATDNVKAATQEVREVLGRFQGQGDALTGNLRLTLDQANEITSDMAEATEALKRNWFFRGFFKKRGYYDLEDITPTEYRNGVLRTKDRATERIWIHSNELFTTTKDGKNVLSPTGEERVDAAMAHFLAYPRDAILMVEGYASGGTRDKQYLNSRRHAVAVRRYLIEKFHVNPQLIGFMPLGAVQSRGENGQPWDGVSLVLFYDKNAKIAEQ